MSKIHATVACNLDSALLAAALPLFANAEIEAIEWSFDTLYAHRNIPPWFIELLNAFSTERRLVGHGVFFSLFSGRWSADQQKWLDHLQQKCAHFNFDHITEHFGFMTGANFHQGAPINIPYNQTTVAIGQDRLKRIYHACQRPVGLENLAFAYALEEVKRHGHFLNELLDPINGFIILDLHNLYCQLHNFDCDYADIINLYPLDRVREIHISGGSWEDSTINPNKKIRRDTHDDCVPDEVFELLKKTIPLCPNLKYVVLEQLGTGLQTDESKIAFQHDFLRMKRIIRDQQIDKSNTSTNNFLPKNTPTFNQPLESTTLAKQQKELSDILENATDYQQATALLAKSSLVHSDWQIEQWQPEMLETVFAITQKWKAGFLSK